MIVKFRTIWPMLTAMAITLLLGGAGAHADVIVLSGILNAAQVVDGGGSTSSATGLATLSINTGPATPTLDAESMTLDFSWTGLTGPADRAHLHDAPVGISRLITDPFDLFFDEVFYSDNPLRTIDCSSWSNFGLCVPASGSLHFVQRLSDIVIYYPNGDPSCDPTTELCSVSQLVDLALNDEIYLDMHTHDFPSGEIRGQLNPVPEPNVSWMFLFSTLFLLWRICPLHRQ